MGANKTSNHKKCGEILMDINSKNKKNKTFLFHCTLCDLECDTLKKFSLHIGDYHLKHSIEILEAEIKFENEDEEFADSKTSTINVFGSDRDGQVNANPDPLDTLNTASSSKGLDFLNCEVKKELEECSNDESSIFDTEVIDSDKEIEKIEIAKTSTDTNFGADTNSESEDFDRTPFKKQKLNSDKKDVNLKLTNDNSSDESKDPEYTQLVIKRMNIKTSEIYSLEPEKELCNTCFDAKYYMDVLFKLQNETITEQKKKILDALAAQNTLTKMLLKQEETSKSLNDMFPISSETTLMDVESQINEHNKYLYVTAIKDLINKNISKNICRVISEEFLYTYNVDGTHGKKRLKNFIMFYDVLKQAVKNSNPEIDDIESEIRKAVAITKKRHFKRMRNNKT